MPTEILRKCQMERYNPEANEVAARMFEESQEITYCTFEDLIYNDKSLPEGTILLIDEVHKLVTKELVLSKSGKLQHPQLRIAEAKRVIGVSATIGSKTDLHALERASDGKMLVTFQSKQIDYTDGRIIIQNLDTCGRPIFLEKQLV